MQINKSKLWSVHRYETSYLGEATRLADKKQIESACAGLVSTFTDWLIYQPQSDWLGADIGRHQTSAGIEGFEEACM